MALDEPDLGPFLAHLVDGLERTLLPDFLVNGLERILVGALVTISFVSMVVSQMVLKGVH